MDKRWQKLGEILVNYSTRVVPGERVMIAMIEPETYPLAKGVYLAAIKAGAFPQVQFLSETLRRCVLKHGNREQIEWIPEMEIWGMEWADVYIGLRGAHNLFELQDIPGEKLAANQAATGVVSQARWAQTRWCLVRVPNSVFAQQAETDEDTITDMFFNSCFLNWEKEAQKWNTWCDRLNKGQEIRITAKNTDLRFSVKGRKWISFAGKINMPDGEIATAPVTETVNGTITFERPGVLGGRLIRDIRLTWKNGELAAASSSTETEFFQSIIGRDKGASLPGEFAFGTNFMLDRFCNDILLDEKIGGTIHIALGRAYPECGGTNQSPIHWDIVKDIRNEGCVLLDGDPILESGKILL
jgi:aminopeptidase